MRVWQWVLALTLRVELVASMCEKKSDVGRTTVMTIKENVEGSPMELVLLCGDDPAAAVARFVTKKTSVTNGNTVVKLAKKLETSWESDKKNYRIPDRLDVGTDRERPRILKTGGMYSRRAAEHSKKSEHAMAVADLVRALLRPGIDPTAKDRLTSLLSEELKKSEKRHLQAAKDGDLSALFDALELEDNVADNSDVDRSSLKQLYRQLSVKYHPDKNPDAAARFNRIRDAYEVLSDPVKTLLYDTSGIEAVRKYEGGGGDLERNENDEKKVFVTLEDAYNGKTMTLSHNRQVVCRSCRLRPDLPRCKACRRCPGEKQIQQRWINEMQFVQEEVEIPSKEKCTHAQTQVDVTIERGVAVGERVNFPGLASQLPGKITGDYQVSVWLKQHELFKRSGNDLSIVVKVSLFEALLGFEREVRHLDGHIVKFGVDRGSVLKPGLGLVIEGEGMPLREDPTTFGRLLVKFEIEFPTSIPPQAIDGLEASLAEIGLGPQKQKRVTQSVKSKSEL